MVTNIKRFRKDMERENNPIADRDDNGHLIYMDIIPVTYNLPSEYTIFVQEFKKYNNAIWIAKPIAGAQGKGISFVRKFKELQKFEDNRNPHVISRYID